MFTRFTKSFAGAALAAGVLGMSALVSAGVANAGSVDNKFLALLEEHGIVPPNSQEAVELAHDICSALDDGQSPKEVVSDVSDVTGLDAETSDQLARDAASVYCPEYVNPA